MANIPNDRDEAKKTIQDQIDILREEMDRLRESASDKMSDLYEEGSRNLRTAADTVKENPGTAATVLTATALVGVLIGFALGQANSESSRRNRWY